MDVNTLAIGFLIFLARIGDVSIGTVRTIVTVQGRSVVALQSALRYYMKLSLITDIVTYSHLVAIFFDTD